MQGCDTRSAKAEGLPEMHILRDLAPEGLVIQDRDGNITSQVRNLGKPKTTRRFTYSTCVKMLENSNSDPVTADDFVYAIRRGRPETRFAGVFWYLKLTQINNIADVAEGKKPVEELGISAVGQTHGEVRTW